MLAYTFILDKMLICVMLQHYSSLFFSLSLFRKRR